MVAPVPNEIGLLVSPLMANALDIDYYQTAREIYIGNPELILQFFLQTLTGADLGRVFLPGPVFPMLLHLFSYGPENSLPLSGLYLVVSCGLVTAWLWWLNDGGLHPAALSLFALLPTPFWFMLNVSTDLLFAGLIGAFWLIWFSKPLNANFRMVCILVVVALAVLLRPNALSLLLYLCIDVLIWEFCLEKEPEKKRRGLLFAGFVLLLTTVFAVFYFGYFQVVMQNGNKISYFGVSAAQFADGLFPDCPNIINISVSWMILLGAKILYLAGLRPSYGDVLTPLAVLRFLPGLVILPGLLYLPFLSDRRKQLFLAVFIAPMILSIAQERYLLPIQPILFFYGILAWQSLFNFARGLGR